MSYQSWHNYGYGICVDDIETTADKVFELVHLAPEFEKKFYKWAETYREDGDPDDIKKVITMLLPGCRPCLSLLQQPCDGCLFITVQIAGGCFTALTVAVADIR